MKVSCRSQSLVVVLALSLLGCRSDARGVVEIRGATMGTTYSVKFVGFETARGAVREAVEDALARVNSEFSTYVEDSTVARFNAARSTEPIEVGASVRDQVARSLRLARATDGAFDPTVYPLLAILPLPGRSAEKPPSEGEIEQALQHVGHEKLDLAGPTALRKSDPLLAVDPNSFAKGYGVDRVAGSLSALGLRDFLVEIGGELRAAGRKPDGSAWRVAIERPFQDLDGAPASVVELSEASLATSGSYRQFFESDGERVHHILDPRTGRNAPTNVVSVSVRAVECAVADALATALMVTGPDGLSSIEAEVGTEFGALFLISGEAGVVQHSVRW